MSSYGWGPERTEEYYYQRVSSSPSARLSPTRSRSPLRTPPRQYVPAASTYGSGLYSPGLYSPPRTFTSPGHAAGYTRPSPTPHTTVLPTTVGSTGSLGLDSGHPVGSGSRGPFRSPGYRVAGLHNTLYGIEQSCNCLGPLLLLRHSRIPFDFQRVDLQKREQFRPEFLAKNPKHCVPTYEDKSGIVVWESNAILRFIVHSNSLQEYYPIDDAGRALTDLVLDWRSNSVYPNWAKLAYPALGFGTTSEHEAVAAREALAEDLNILVRHFLGAKSFVGGNIPSIADFALAPLLHVLAHPALQFPLPPGVHEYHQRFLEKVPVSHEVFQALDQALDAKRPRPAPTADPGWSQPPLQFTQ